MKISRIRALFLLAPLALAFAGCSEKSEVQDRTKITTPEGTKTITRSTKVEESGNPPSTTPPSGTSTPR